MCIEKSIKLKFTKRPRYFYKVLLVRGYRFYSPYRNTEVLLNYPYSTSLGGIRCETQIYRSKVYGYAKLFVTFGEGLFFVCRTKMAAKHLIKRDLNSNEQYIIVRAVVPKGALIMSDGFQIATNCVTYTQII